MHARLGYPGVAEVAFTCATRRVCLAKSLNIWCFMVTQNVRIIPSSTTEILPDPSNGRESFFTKSSEMLQRTQILKLGSVKEMEQLWTSRGRLVFCWITSRGVALRARYQRGPIFFKSKQSRCCIRELQYV